MAYIPKLEIVQDAALPYVWYVKAVSEKTRNALNMDAYTEAEQHTSKGLAIACARLSARRAGYGKVSIDRTVLNT